MTGHIIKVKSTQLHVGDVPPEMSEYLVNEGVARNILGNEFTGQGPPLDFKEELKCVYECSCGQRFRKGKTAKEHLDEHRNRS